MIDVAERVDASLRRTPVIHASLSISARSSSATLRAAQQPSVPTSKRSGALGRGSFDAEVEVVARLRPPQRHERLGEVEAGVEEDDLDIGVDLGRHVHEHGVGHRRGDRDAGPEGLDGPSDDLLGRPGLHLAGEIVEFVEFEVCLDGHGKRLPVTWLAVARSKPGKSDQLSRNSAVLPADRQPAWLWRSSLIARE